MTILAGSCAESYSKLLMQGVAFLSAVLVQVFSLCVSMTAAHNRTEKSAGVGLNETYLAQLVIQQVGHSTVWPHVRRRDGFATFLAGCVCRELLLLSWLEK